jgi:hypothetical protein
MKPRYSPRLPLQAGATFTTDDGIGHGHIQDLSVPGCRLDTTADLRVGHTLRLHVTFKPVQASLHIDRAVVRWVEPPWAGLEFIGMSVTEQGRLRRLVGYRDWQTIFSPCPRAS